MAKLKAVDCARATLRRAKRTDAAKISLTRITTQRMETASTWSSAEVQSAAQRWNDAAHALEGNASKIRGLQTELALAQTQQRVHRRAWEVATQHVLAVVTTASHGRGDVVAENGFDIHTRGKNWVEAPGDLHGMAGRDSGDAVFQWTCPTARNGYIVQSATEPSDARTYSELIPCTRTKFTVRGLAPRSVVHFRVAAIDPTSATGKGAWSGWESATSR